MHKTIYLLLLIYFAGCNSKEEKPSSKIKNQNPERTIQVRLNGKQIVDELLHLGYFNLTDSAELEKVKLDFENAYNDLKVFQGPTRGKTMKFMDNRYFWIDCEELFEIGGLTEYLELVQPTFEMLNLTLNYANEKSEQQDNYWKHTIEINDTEYVAFDGELTDLNWGIAYVNFLEMLNYELRMQGLDEQFYPISCGNEGYFVLLKVKQFNFISQHYPDDTENPTTLSAWKTINGI